MDEIVQKIDSPEKCETFAKNAKARGREDLAKQAIQRAIQIRAELHGAETVAEKEALEAVYAYEEVLSAKNGRRTRASRTWPMIERHGIIEAVERAVNRKDVTQGYTALLDMGLEDFAFEAVILRHPDQFSENAVAISQKRISEVKSK